MTNIDLKDAQLTLPKLIHKAWKGERVVITSEDGAHVLMVPLPKKEVARPKVARPKFGSARGLIKIGDDFDDP